MFGLLAGCGGGGGGKPITEREFCAQKAEAECQVSDDCVTTDGLQDDARWRNARQFVGHGEGKRQARLLAGNIGRLHQQDEVGLRQDLGDHAHGARRHGRRLQLRLPGQRQGQRRTGATTKYDCADKVICDKAFCATQGRQSTTTCGNPGDICADGNYCAQNSSQVSRLHAQGRAARPARERSPAWRPCAAPAEPAPIASRSALACTTNDDCGLGAVTATRTRATKCDPGLSFAAGSPSCADFGGSGSGPGTGGSGGGGGAGGSGGPAVARRPRWRRGTGGSGGGAAAGGGGGWQRRHGGSGGSGAPAARRTGGSGGAGSRQRRPAGGGGTDCGRSKPAAP